MEITVNAKQVIAAIWTVIAIVISIIITLGMNFQSSTVPWWMMIAVFFGVLLLITLPVYLLIVLWALVTKEGE